MSKYGLDQRSLEIPCGDDLFMVLVQEMESYERLAPYLRITVGQVYSIQRNTPHDYSLGKLCFLQLWREEKGGEATYYALVRAFLGMHDRQTAECIIRHAKNTKCSGKLQYVVY